MREHPLMGSPLAPFVDLNEDPDRNFAQRPYDESETWPSELGQGGKVRWKRFPVGADGFTNVVYPDIRWDQLRSDHGWVALQYQVTLRNTLCVPRIGLKEKTPIRIDLIQGVEFALIPSTSSASTPSSSSEILQTPVTWYNGDIYDFASTPDGIRDQSTSTSNFARSLLLDPGEYLILVRAIYEIRMFGDPGVGNPPVIRMKVQIEVEEEEDQAVLVEGIGKVPDVIEGLFMGNWISVGVRLPEGLEVVTVMGVESTFANSITVELPREVKIMPGQTRLVAVKLQQKSALPACCRSFEVRLKIRAGYPRQHTRTLVWHPKFQHLDLGDEALPPFRISFASPPPAQTGTPAHISHAMVVPPRRPLPVQPTSEKVLPPVILALHGAGVDAIASPWKETMPEIPGVWAVLPTGRNEWGEDWHGGSMEDVWAARDAFSDLSRHVGFATSDKTILMGHSNGGQGAWHLAARYADRIVGLVAASGWLTIQHYVPYTETTSTHYADPALVGILSSSLAPYNNDLYLSNLVDIPILIIHGSEDDNVPPRHSKAYVNLISSWAGKQASDTVKLVEIPRKGHWWEDVLRSTHVTDFIVDLPPQKSWDEQRRQGFTLTTANPQESGGRAGIRIVELDIPGRLARLDVNARQWRGDNPAFPLDLRGTNIKRIELRTKPMADGYRITMRKHRESWVQEKIAQAGPLTPPRAYGPMIRILSSRGSITLIIPATSPVHRDIAKRVAHDIFVYHRMDSEIIDDREGLIRVAGERIGDGSVVVIGRPEENLYANWMVKQAKVPLTFPTKGVFLLEDKLVYDRGAAKKLVIGLISLYPHPTSASGLAVLIAGNDDVGLELATRLFPLRTGVPVSTTLVQRTMS
ncbi:hypothetical protein I316_01464 [Kwoniella heveanensis BCC8398]|uniref:Peptidase S9 prolyl oligopeptidase catalytic domain-containing protein n=1 Tax=Kwoniella heveanensis BCC8398 TaxID=1296120 RepID=A0A1B9H0U0_9TREE|nr:hypothetical protein I316_01464 [Kwoniella heveanensis BCC8398]